MNKLSTARCFVAAWPDPSCVLEIEQALRGLKADLSQLPVRWTPVQNWHITLQFLGNTPLTEIERLADKLADAAEKNAPFDMQFDHFNWFPSPSNPVVLACLARPSPTLQALAKTVRIAIAEGASGRQQKKFRGHLTVGRPKQGKVFPIAAAHTCQAQTRVTAIGLYESRLTSKGAIYTEMAHFPFATGG